MFFSRKLYHEWEFPSSRSRSANDFVNFAISLRVVAQGERTFWWMAEITIYTFTYCTVLYKLF